MFHGWPSSIVSIATGYVLNGPGNESQSVSSRDTEWLCSENSIELVSQQIVVCLRASVYSWGSSEGRRTPG